MTLSEFAYQIRVLGKLLAVFFGAAVLFVLMILVLIQSLKKPEQKTLALNTTFGKIEKPLFEASLPYGKMKFALDTIDGDYPVTTPSANVYFIPENKATLAYLTRVEALAQSFGFDTAGVKSERINENWVKYEDAVRKLQIDIKNFHFHYLLKPSSELQKLVEATPSARFTLLEDHFLEVAKQTLSSRNVYPAHLAAGKTNLVYLKYDLAQNKFVPAVAGDIPQAVRVDFFRKDEKLPVVPPKYFESQNYVVMAPLEYYPQEVEVQFMSFDKLDEPGVYPLMSAKEAWERLKKGEVKTISVASQIEDSIKIKEIYLGYYDPLSYQKYFQPVFIFLGDQNYVGYIEAIRPEYLLE